MRRLSAARMLAVLLAGTLLAGCNDKKKETVETTPPADPVLPRFPENQVPPPEPQPAADEQPAPPVDTSVKAEKPAQPLPKSNYAPASTPEPKTYVVQKGDSLQKISRKFYNTNKKWRDIYEANRDVLTGGPDKLQIGMKLRIP